MAMFAATLEKVAKRRDPSDAVAVAREESASPPAAALPAP